MRRYCHKVRLRHRRDLFELQDAAHIAHIGIEYIGGLLLEHLAKLELGVKFLARYHRYVDLLARGGERVYVFGKHRLFVPERAKLLDVLRDADGVHRRKPAVHLDQDVHIRTYGVSHGAHILHGGALNLFADESAPAAGYRIELQCAKAHLYDLRCALRESVRRGRAAGPAVGVHPYLVTASPADELVRRRAVCLARNVPHRMLQPAYGAVVVHCAAPPGEIVVRRLNEVLDVRGIPADEVAPYLIDVRRNLQVAVGLRVAFAPAVNARVRLDFHEAQVLSLAGVNQKCLDVGNLHFLSRNVVLDMGTPLIPSLCAAAPLR